MELNERQERIIEIVKAHSPITGEKIADILNLTRATLRPDLTVLTMAGLLEARPRVGYFSSGKSNDSLVADRLRKLRVGDFKSVPIVVRESTNLYDCIVTMFLEDVGSLTVVSEGGILEGVVSRKDLLKATLGNTDVHRVPVGVVMTRMPNIVWTFADEPVLLAARKIIQHQIDSMPVVKVLQDAMGREKYEVVGRFTKTNITAILVELGEIHLVMGGK
ncbi:MAG: helix-turn-helix transcriptional regulator [Peptococcaceae bacterium]|nr:helix-turn-helix transcriptional regulator [Peptococcaceae bacterium]